MGIIPSPNSVILIYVVSELAGLTPPYGSICGRRLACSCHELMSSIWSKCYLAALFCSGLMSKRNKNLWRKECGEKDVKIESLLEMNVALEEHNGRLQEQLRSCQNRVDAVETELLNKAREHTRANRRADVAVESFYAAAQSQGSLIRRAEQQDDTANAIARQAEHERQLLGVTTWNLNYTRDQNLHMDIHMRQMAAHISQMQQALYESQCRVAELEATLDQASEYNVEPVPVPASAATGNKRRRRRRPRANKCVTCGQRHLRDTPCPDVQREVDLEAAEND